MRSREPCGCVHDGYEWVKMCEPCTVEFNETHVRWAIEHNERAADRERAEADVGKVLDVAYGRVEK